MARLGTMKPAFAAILTLLLALGNGARSQEPASTTAADQEPHWIPLFNGKDLDGWTPKIVGHPAGENFANTFRVEDGLLKVAYDGYGDDFGGRFGHLFYAREFGHYRLRVEYRFTGEPMHGGPGWAFRNSGVMIHGQAPETMALAQDFPVSIEVQLLGGDGTNPRPTANLCTPGTNVVMADANGVEELVTRHCTDSSAPTFHGDGWVTVEIEVHGNGTVRHWVDGKCVLSYTHPQLDPNDRDAQALIAAGAPLQLDHGTLSLQSESHPIEFRRVELLELAPDEEPSGR